MRGVDHQRSQMFSYLSPETRGRKDHPLREIRAMVDEGITRLSRRVFGASGGASGREEPHFGRTLHSGWDVAGSVGEREEFSAEGRQASTFAGRPQQSDGELSRREAVEPDPCIEDRS